VLSDHLVNAVLIVGTVSRERCDGIGELVEQRARPRGVINLFPGQLNRGEFRHILAKWLFFANQGDLRSGDYEEVMNKASCLSLLSNAVLVWNTVHMTRILTRLRAAGQEVDDDDLVRVSPFTRSSAKKRNELVATCSGLRLSAL
jgi:hypothetical protein